ncbi:hypothetical protein D5041_16975 [Verminephrobacter aporrectodeae subsp. tuberculatae]|nr:hypothetical protein [Verminephrobacter aporrectodeae subsp. tuberculatae]MCW5257691.1 hypothetical protein [Verminephrobacter aporrectodeae subsp. tuberculatae]MCW5290671.1 hypothetical protein [Verminephrobacter aporrectodeae subsp. tuberculatae]
MESKFANIFVVHEGFDGSSGDMNQIDIGDGIFSFIGYLNIFSQRYEYVTGCISTRSASCRAGIVMNSIELVYYGTSCFIYIQKMGFKNRTDQPCLMRSIPGISMLYHMGGSPDDIISWFERNEGGRNAFIFRL